MKLITLTVVLVTASTAIAQAPPAAPAPGDTPGEVDLGPHGGPNGWMGAYTPPAEGDPTCWYLRQPAGEWINVCSRTPTYSQTVVPPPYTSTPTPTMSYKTHPHQWHQRPRKPRPTWTAPDAPIWW